MCLSVRQRVRQKVIMMPMAVIPEYQTWYAHSHEDLFSHFIVRTSMPSGYYYLHFIDTKTKVQRG